MVPRLREAKLKITSIRLTIAKQLAEETNPLAVAELHLDARLSACNLTTIYRNVLALEEAGLVTREREVIGPTRFLWKTETPAIHSHDLKCRRCGNTFSLAVCGLKATVRRLEEAGFREVSHALEFHGVCRGCWLHQTH